MSANIHIAKDGTAATFTATGKRGKPWHQLGQMVEGAQTWENAMKLAKLDWTVSKHPLLSPFSKEAVDTYGIFRDDTHDFLGNVGAIYQPIQNKKAFEHVDALLESENGAHYESAGALGNGARIWCLARVPFDFSIGDGSDKHETYLLFTNPHNSTASAKTKLTITRVVCQNTLNMALGEKGATMTVRHTINVEARLDAARLIMTGVKQTVTSLREKLETLSKKRMTPEASLKVMDTVFGAGWQTSNIKKNQVTQIANLFQSNDNNAFPKTAGTAYNLFNAFTEWNDHMRGVTNLANNNGTSAQVARAESALFTRDDWKSNALDAILSQVSTMPSMTATTSKSAVASILDKMAI